MITQKELIDFALNVRADFKSLWMPNGESVKITQIGYLMTELPNDNREYCCERDGIVYGYQDGYIYAYDKENVANTFVDVFYDEEGFYNKTYIH